MKSSQEIIEVLETTYPESMAKKFNTIEDCEKYMERKCNNFKKIFQDVCSDRMVLEVDEFWSYYCFIKTSDSKIVFSINGFIGKTYDCNFTWRRF
jgi:hypothetical protein